MTNFLFQANIKKKETNETEDIMMSDREEGNEDLDQFEGVVKDLKLEIAGRDNQISTLQDQIKNLSNWMKDLQDDLKHKENGIAQLKSQLEYQCLGKSPTFFLTS